MLVDQVNMTMAASNDERKQKQFRTGEWRTNKKEAFSWGARLSFDIYTTFIFPTKHGPGAKGSFLVYLLASVVLQS